MVENLYGDKAEYYDILYQDKNYEGEVDYIVKKFSEYLEKETGKILVVGCGTGNHSKQLIERGFEVKAVDPYEGMLEIAREKSDADFSQDSLPELETIEDKFDLIFLPYTIVNHISESEIEDSFARLYELLTEEGVLIFDNIDLPDEESLGPWLEISEEDGVELSRHTQVVKVDDKKFDWRSEITVSNGDFFIDQHTIYRHTDQRITELLEQAGFQTEKNEDGYEANTERDIGTVFIAIKKK